MCDGENKVGLIVGITVPGGLLLILAIVLISLSVDVLDVTEIGLDYNALTTTTDYSKLYQPGRHFLGFPHYFKKFPLNVQTITFNSTSAYKIIPAKTSDGLSCFISLKCYYKFNPNLDDLVYIYSNYSESYEGVYVALTQKVVQNTFATFDTLEVSTLRAEIELAIYDTLRKEFENEKMFLDQIQLLDITYDSTFEKRLLEWKQVTLTIQQITNSRETIKNQLEGKELLENLRIQVKKNNVDARVKDITYTYSGIASVKKEYLNGISTGIKEVKSQLGYRNRDILMFLYTQNMDKADYFNFPKPRLINCASDSSLAYCQ